MARGWESKSIEMQQDDARRRVPAGRPAPADAARTNARRLLELARARAEADLARASAPAHRQMLASAIDALDRQLAMLDVNGPNPS